MGKWTNSGLRTGELKIETFWWESFDKVCEEVIYRKMPHTLSDSVVTASDW